MQFLPHAKTRRTRRETGLSRSLRFPERSRFHLRVFASSREPVSGGDHRGAVACVREPIACRKTAARPPKEGARLQKEAVSPSKRRPMYKQRSSLVGRNCIESWCAPN